MKIVPILAISLALPAVYGAELKPETLAAWEQYLHAANSRMQARLRSSSRFLWLSETPDRLRRVQNGEIVASPVGESCPKKVPNGLIHHWIGAVFVPNADRADISAVLRDFERYKEFYAPLVVDSKTRARDGSDDQFSMVLLNQALLSKTALHCECAASYSSLDGTRWYGVSYTTRIQQIENYSQAGEQELAPDVGTGYLWRLYSLSRFEERDGGVYVEVEAIALSRDIPLALRWLADPIVRRVSRGSLLTSLEQTRTAVTSTVLATAGDPKTLPSWTSATHTSGLLLESLRSLQH